MFPAAHKLDFDINSILDRHRWQSSVWDTVPDAYSLPDDEVYLDKVHDILNAPPCIGVPPQPSKIYRNIYLGTQANGENLKLLKQLNITHVLNCAGLPSTLYSARARHYPPESGIRYEELPIDDSEDFELAPYLQRAHSFIDRTSISDGILIYCSGVSRSGAITISYLIRSGILLLSAVKLVKNARRVALCNHGFMHQLVKYARTLGMLEAEVEHRPTTRYYRPLDKHRINSAHLPTFL